MLLVADRAAVSPKRNSNLAAIHKLQGFRAPPVASLEKPSKSRNNLLVIESDGKQHGCLRSQIYLYACKHELATLIRVPADRLAVPHVD